MLKLEEQNIVYQGSQIVSVTALNQTFFVKKVFKVKLYIQDNLISDRN